MSDHPGRPTRAVVPTHDQAASSGREAWLPDRLSAWWRDLPALSWTVACAYATGPAWLRRLAAPVCALLLWLPALAGYQARRAVARRSRHAVLLIGPQSRGARLRSLAVILVVLPIAMGLFGAAALACAVVVASVTGADIYVVGLVLATAAFACLLVGLLTLVVRGVPSLSRLGRERRAGAVEGWDQALRGDVFAAWPQGRGHGTDLLEELHAAAPDVAVMAVARDARVAALYGRFGLQPIAAGSLIVTRDRGQIHKDTN